MTNQTDHIDQSAAPSQRRTVVAENINWGCCGMLSCENTNQHQGAPCPVCTPRREANGQPPRLPRRPGVCDACRNWFLAAIADIEEYAVAGLLPPDEPPRSWRRPTTPAELEAAHRFEPAPRSGREPDPDRCAECGHRPGAARHRRVRDTTTVRPDPVRAVIPAGHTRAAAIDAAVSGSREAPAPVSLDVLDLTNRPRHRIVDAATGAAAGLTPTGRIHLGDQIGHLPVATVLDTLVTDWIAHRGLGEHRPHPSVLSLCRWLRVRLDDACDDHPDMAGAAVALRDIRSALHHAAGRVDIPELAIGVPCPSCGIRDLWRVNGTGFVECGSCPRMLTEAEFDLWVHGEASEAWTFLVSAVAVAGLLANRAAIRPRDALLAG